MGCSASHVAQDKDELDLIYAEEGRSINTHETRKQEARREAKETKIKIRREEILAEHRVKAIKYLEKGDLDGLMKHMDFLLYEKKIAKRMRKKNQKQRKRHDDQLATAKVVVEVIRKVNEKGQEEDKVQKAELELFPADKFWLMFLWCYSKFLEGLAPIPGTRVKVGVMGIPVASNLINIVQNLCTPLIMVAIPKWIRCPPSVMYPVWWSWLTCTLFAYIPLYGTYRWIGRAPVTKATQRLSVYLYLRRLMRDSTPLDRDGNEIVPGVKVKVKKRRSNHLTKYLHQEVVYPNSLHKDINGDWSTFCNFLW